MWGWTIAVHYFSDGHQGRSRDFSRGTQNFANPPPSLPPYNNVFIWCFISDEQLLLTDISSNHNLLSLLFEFIYPAACYHLRPSSYLFSKYIGPPLVVSLETVGGAYMQKNIKKYLRHSANMRVSFFNFFLSTKESKKYKYSVLACNARKTVWFWIQRHGFRILFQGNFFNGFCTLLLTGFQISWAVFLIPDSKSKCPTIFLSLFFHISLPRLGYFRSKRKPKISELKNVWREESKKFSLSVIR